MTKYHISIQNYLRPFLGTQVGSNFGKPQEARKTAALSAIHFWERSWERRIKNLGFLRVVASHHLGLPVGIPKNYHPKKWLKPLVDKALRVFAAFPLPKLRYQPKPLILLNFCVTKIPIYYIYRWVSADTPYKYNFGFAAGLPLMVGGAL